MAEPAPVGTATTNVGQAGPVSVAAPTGVTAGDHQVVEVVMATTGESLAATPAGWLQMATTTMASALSGADTTRAYLFRSDPDNDPGSAAFSQAKVSGTRLWRTNRFAYRGGTGPTGATFAVSAASSQTHAVPQQTTTVDDSVVVGGIILDQSGALNVFTTGTTPPAGWDELLDQSSQSVSGTVEVLTTGIAAVGQPTAGVVNGSFGVGSTGPSGTGDDALMWSLTMVADADVPPELPTLVQQSAVEFSGAAALTLDATLPDAATADNIIWFCVAGDKDLEILTGPTDFERTIYLHTGNVSLLMAYKVADGGETTISATTESGNNLSGSDVWVGEYEQAGSDPWQILGNGDTPDDGTDVLVRGTGTTGTLAAAGLALAGWAVDSVNTEGTATYDPITYTERANPSHGATGGAGLWLAELEIATGGSTTGCTVTRAGGAAADQMSGGVVVFGRANPVVSATAAAALGGLTATATGVRDTSGTAAAPLGALSATATGVRSVEATAAAPLGGLTATASGARVHDASAVATLGALAASATGTRALDATASAPLGALTAAATGDVTVSGTAAAPLGGLTAAASGTVTPPNSGTAAADLGGLTAAATGTRETAATATAALGGLTAATAAVKDVTATLTAPLGPLTAAAVADTASGPTAAAPLGSLAATATGERTVSATAAASLGPLTAAATAVRAGAASATANLGALTATATVPDGSGPEPGRFFLAY